MRLEVLASEIGNKKINKRHQDGNEEVKKSLFASHDDPCRKPHGFKKQKSC